MKEKVDYETISSVDESSVLMPVDSVEKVKIKRKKQVEQSNVKVVNLNLEANDKEIKVTES